MHAEISGGLTCWYVLEMSRYVVLNALQCQLTWIRNALIDREANAHFVVREAPAPEIQTALHGKFLQVVSKLVAAKKLQLATSPLSSPTGSQTTAAPESVPTSTASVNRAAVSIAPDSSGSRSTGSSSTLTGKTSPQPLAANTPMEEEGEDSHPRSRMLLCGPDRALSSLKILPHDSAHPPKRYVAAAICEAKPEIAGDLLGVKHSFREDSASGSVRVFVIDKARRVHASVLEKGMLKPAPQTRRIHTCRFSLFNSRVRFQLHASEQTVIAQAMNQDGEVALSDYRRYSYKENELQAISTQTKRCFYGESILYVHSEARVETWPVYAQLTERVLACKRR